MRCLVYTQTHTADRLLFWASKVVGKDNVLLHVLSGLAGVIKAWSACFTAADEVLVG